MPKVTKLYEGSRKGLAHNMGGVFAAPKKQNNVAACRRRCREQLGPASKNYDPVALANCQRNCQN